MKLGTIINIADEAYDVDGVVAWYHADPKGNYGDGLAKFIAIEIAETYDPKAEDIPQLAEARRVIEQGLRQMESVAAALLKKEMQLEAARRRQTHPVRKQRQNHLRGRGGRVPRPKR